MKEVINSFIEKTITPHFGVKHYNVVCDTYNIAHDKKINVEAFYLISYEFDDPQPKDRIKELENESILFLEMLGLRNAKRYFNNVIYNSEDKIIDIIAYEV